MSPYEHAGSANSIFLDMQTRYITFSHAFNPGHPVAVTFISRCCIPKARSSRQLADVNLRARTEYTDFALPVQSYSESMD